MVKVCILSSCKLFVWIFVCAYCKYISLSCDQSCFLLCYVFNFTARRWLYVHEGQVVPQFATVLDVWCTWDIGIITQSIVMSVCVCVCLSVRSHIFGTARSTFTNFLSVLPVAMARSSSGSVIIHYILLVLWMMSYLLISQGCSMSPPSWSAVHMQTWAWL